MKHLYLIFFTASSLISFAQNNPPVANVDVITTSAGGTKTILPKQNDTDPDGNAISIDTFFYDSGIGVVVKLGTSALKYTADSFYYGLDTIYYVICDNGIPSLCDTGLIIVSVEYKFYDRYEFLDENNISARFNTSGSNFWDLVGFAQFEVPKGSGINSIFAGSVWIGGKDDANGLHLAAQRFKDNGEEFFPGPIMDSSVFPPSVPFAFQYEINKWNRMWKVKKSEVDFHISSWNQPGYSIPEPILNWPAHGDTSLGQEYYLAPYYDNNWDGKYNPVDGDYPIIRGDQTVFFMYNDNHVHEQSGGIPLKTEVHGTAYSFNCPDSALQHTVFVNYKFINRSPDNYHDTYFGIWVDGDLGDYQDDYVGCDVQRGSFYYYNGDNNDNDNGGAKGYGTYVPAQSVTILAGPLQDLDGADNPLVFDYNDALTNYGIPYAGLGSGYGDEIIDNERLGLTHFRYFNNNTSVSGDPQSFGDYYKYMTGYWRDGTPMVYGGNGHVAGGGTSSARYMFPGNSDPLAWGTSGTSMPLWDEVTAGNTPADRRGVGSVGPFTFGAGDIAELDIAYVFGRDYQVSGAAAGVAVMKQRIDAVRELFENDSTPCGGKFSPSSITNVSKVESQISIYPNPSTDNITIHSKLSGNVSFELNDLVGKKVMDGKINSAYHHISLAEIKGGIYFLRIKESGKMVSFKIIKL